jgi:tRNA (guanine9-N1)-methyltransferase
MSIQGNFSEWTFCIQVRIHTESYLKVFPKEELVYLTSDSPNEIQTLDSQKVYIIGGLVDHNRLKVSLSHFSLTQHYKM